MNDELEDKLKNKLSGANFTVPESYFNDLSERIKTRLSLEQMVNHSDHHGFKVPDLYFEQVNAQILSRISPQVSVAKQVKMVRWWNSDLLKYSTAACFVVVTALGLYLNNHPSVSANTNPDLANEQILFDIDEQAIIDHVQTEDSKTTTSATQKELEDYILNNYSQNDIASNF